MSCFYWSPFAIFPLTNRRYFLGKFCCRFEENLVACRENLSSISFSRCASCPSDSIRRGANFLEKTKECENNKKRDEGLHAPNWHIAVIYPRLVICRSAMANRATTIKVAQFNIPSRARRRFTRGRRCRRGRT